MLRIPYSNKRNQIQIQKRRFALKVICNENLNRPRNFGDIDSYGDMGTGRNLAKNL